MIFFSRRFTARILLSIILPVIFLTSFSPSATSTPNEMVSLNFVNADIEEVIRAVSHITGRNFVLDPRVKGTINIVSSTPVAAGLAYDILLSTLRMQGFAAVEAGGVTKIMPEADAKLYVSSTNDHRGSGEKLVTRVYVLKYESAAQLVPVLRPLIAPNNIIVAYPNNTLVVTDYASNLKRIEQIIDAIDQPSKAEPVIIPVKRTSAVELAQTINRLLQDSASGTAGLSDSSQRFLLLAEARTNSLLVRTENQEKLTRVRDLVQKLDTDTGTLGNMHVVYLKNAEAVKLAQTLRSVLSGDLSAATSGSSAPISVAPPGSASPSAAPSGGGMIQADASSNALIITAPNNIFNNMRAVIDMLDVRRAQVFVEALIAEVSADKLAEFGIQWQGAKGDITGNITGGGTNFGSSGQNILSVAANPYSIGPGLNAGVINGGNLGVLARAMQTNTDVNVLSTPNLMMLDNEEAKITIGENVPFITGSQNGTASNPNPFVMIERKDVGLILKIKPQVSEGGSVKMLIFQEVSSVKETTATTTASAGPTTVKRSIETTVLVNDGQTLVLGGLIDNQVDVKEYKVPLLGDIPLIGWLFRYETRHLKKTNLMVFIRPSVLRTANSANNLTQDRYQYLRGQQEQSQIPWNLILPSMPAPVSPELMLPLSPELKKAPAEAEPAINKPVKIDDKSEPESKVVSSPTTDNTPTATPPSSDAAAEPTASFNH